MGSLVVRPFVLCVALLATGPQTPPSDPALLAEGLRLTAQLTLDVAEDQARSQRVGIDRAQQLLAAVMSHGQRPDATREDWAAMHRAVDGLIALYLLKGEGVRAAVFAGMQSLLYQTLDQDLPRALAAAERGLELKRASGDTTTIFFEQMTIGQLLMAMGQPDEALPFLRTARASYPDLLSDVGSLLWHRIVRAEIARLDDGDVLHGPPRRVDAVAGPEARLARDAEAFRPPVLLGAVRPHRRAVANCALIAAAGGSLRGSHDARATALIAAAARQPCGASIWHPTAHKTRGGGPAYGRKNRLRRMPDDDGSGLGSPQAGLESVGQRDDPQA
jgi:hypothetical protein